MIRKKLSIEIFMEPSAVFSIALYGPVKMHTIVNFLMPMVTAYVLPNFGRVAISCFSKKTLKKKIFALQK